MLLNFYLKVKDSNKSNNKLQSWGGCSPKMMPLTQNISVSIFVYVFLLIILCGSDNITVRNNKNTSKRLSVPLR